MSAFDGPDLDPTDWEAVRRQGHRMLDDMLDHMASLSDGPVWREPPEAIRAGFREPLPAQGQDLAHVHDRFLREVLPYSSGNAHPGFMGWVQGGGTVVGALAEMLAAAMNPNCGGRNHMALEVERQVGAWMAEAYRFPETANGLFTTGASQANFLAILIARTRALGPDVRTEGLGETGARLRAYASAAVHGCVGEAMDMAGLGTAALRRIPIDDAHRIRLDALNAAIAEDRAQGLTPFMVIGSAGTVDVGAMDDLAGLADIASREGLHFHVDGAIGALGIFSPTLAPRLAGAERADSIAFDWHKLGQVPYDAGFLLTRDRELQRQTFAGRAVYLRRHRRGLAGGEWWPSDYGPDLSRGFRALKTWFTLKTYGTRALGEVIAKNVALAADLAARVGAEPELELLAPVDLNIVCFGYRGPDPDALNTEIVARLHEGGHPSPSTTVVDGRVVIRAAIVNHRTGEREIAELVERVLAFGRELVRERGA